MNQSSVSNGSPTTTAQFQQHHLLQRRDVGIQTETQSQSSRFMRTFSVMESNHGTPSRRKGLDDDVKQLFDSCRRYQVKNFVIILLLKILLKNVLII